MKKKLFVFTPFLIATFLAGIYLFTGCQKNVGVITNIIKYDISGKVSDTQSAGIGGVEIFLDGVSVATTNPSGNYVITKVVPGTYVVEAKKTGYSINKFDLVVLTTGYSISELTLKKLSTPVSITPATGGTIVEKGATGNTPAITLSIPAGAITSGNGAAVSISVTNLVGNEAPKVPAQQLSSGQAAGVTVSLDSSDPNLVINPAIGITLEFVLPFAQRPGTTMPVVTLNEKTGLWNNYDATVGPDGTKASLKIYHFSNWTLVVNAGFPQTSTNVPFLTVNFPATGIVVWTSTLEFPDGIPAEITDPSFLYGFVENQTGLVFSTYKNGTATPTYITARDNNLSISAAPNSDPAGYSVNRPWELLNYSYNVTGQISVETFDIPSNAYVNKVIRCKFDLPSYYWGWRESTTLAYPTTQPYAKKIQTSVTQIILTLNHNL